MSRLNAIAAAIVLAILAAVGWLIISLSGGAASSQSAPPTASASAKPSKTGLTQPTSDPLAATQHDPFIDRVLSYEVAYLSRNKPNAQQLMAPFATTGYLADHKPAPDDARLASRDADVMYAINQDLTKTKVVVTSPGNDPTTRFVSVKALVTTSRIDGGGRIVPILSDFQLPQHSTTWKLVNGVWLVDQER